MKANEFILNELEIIYTNPAVKLGLKKVVSSIDAHKLLKPYFNKNTLACQEEFIVMYMNQGSLPVGIYKAGKGGLTSTIADMRLIFGVGLKSLATSMIVAHNHPSGTLLPSQADKVLTRKIQEIGLIMDITLTDHLIVTPSDCYYSFADQGLI
jgi:DNA repair protein RadC